MAVMLMVTMVNADMCYSYMTNGFKNEELAEAQLAKDFDLKILYRKTAIEYYIRAKYVCPERRKESLIRLIKQNKESINLMIELKKAIAEYDKVIEENN